MSTQYNGISANISGNLPASKNIASSTNTNPIVIQTSTAHGLTTGDYADVKGHQTNTSANAVWPVTVIDSTHFSVPNAGIGVGGATGTVQSLALGPTGAIPSDGDADVAASVNAQFERLADQTAFLGLGTGYLKLAGRVVLQNTFGPSNNWCHIAGATIGPSTWNTLLTDVNLTVLGAEQGCLSVNTGGPGAGNPFVCSVDGIAGADIVEITMETNVTIQSSGDYYGLFWALTAPGVAMPTLLSGFTRLTGSAKGGNSFTGGIRMSGQLSHPGTGRLWIAPAYYANASAARTVAMTDDTMLVVSAWRLTGMPQ
jgi:hypothetical protein